MEKQTANEDYVWVITQGPEYEENFVGLVDDQNAKFVPVTMEKFEAEAIKARLPNESGQLQVEAIHREQLIKEAGEQGFAVKLVDAAGVVKQTL